MMGRSTQSWAAVLRGQGSLTGFQGDELRGGGKARLEHRAFPLYAVTFQVFPFFFEVSSCLQRSFPVTIIKPLTAI